MAPKVATQQQEPCGKGLGRVTPREGQGARARLDACCSCWEDTA